MAVQQGSEFQSLTGYSLVEEVHSSSKTLVYRAIRLADQQPVVIKLLRQEYPSFAELLQFRNQYTLTQAIDSDAIIRHYDLLPFRNGYALVMEDFGAISLRQYLYQQRLGLEAVLTIALQLTEALAILHQQRIIHKDIKPANILINPESHQVKLTDFSVSSLLPRETQEAPNPQVIEGTLAYLSPEQTGRMNRGVDYRSDYYSLGVTLFELLTQQLPFPSTDPLELLHSHMAVKPPLVSGLVPSVPLGLARIVQKLMAKNAEDRYQTALGLKHDLQHCLQQYHTHGTIEAFELGQRDVSDRFLLPERLYGRQAEVAALLAAFERIVDPEQAAIGADGRELILITGLSGIGKTSVVNEVYKPIARGVASLQGRRQGYFIRGKFDQVQRNVPLFAFVQAFRSLIGQLLAETDQQIAQWKTQLQAALGDSAQVIIDVIPELEQILGAQPPAPELLGSAAQNRYNRLFQQFIQVFATPEHPLVIFLDDLQWADRASLNLMQLLLGEVEGAVSLLLIGAYRDNEVTPAHPLMLTLRQLQQTVRTTTIALNPLTRDHVNQLVAATLSRSTTETPSLTELVYQKAQGNPFFTRQFIKSLYTEGAIAFDRAHQLWDWDLAKVQLLALAEDVVDFMATQLQKLAPPTQDVLQLAACIGSQFNLATLAIAAGRTPAETAQDLWNALQVGFLVPLDENYRVFQQPLGLPDRVPSIAALSYRTRYRFLHDRVQQAAYSLIPDDRKPATHLKIGRFLLQKVPPQQREEHLFDILNQLNAGLSLVTEPTQRLELAELNLAAGRKAKQATAYDAADSYLAQGRSLLPEGSWQTYYDLTLALWLKSIEIAYLRGDYAQMQALAETVLNQARSLLDRIPAYEVLIQAEVAQHQLLSAVELGLHVLTLLGSALPQEPTEAQVMESFQTVTVAMEERSIAQLLDLPTMTDPVGLAVMRISLGIAAAAYNAVPSLYILLVLNLVQQSLRLGNAAESAYAYASYGFIVNAFSGQVDRGYDLNQLALQLLTKLNAKALTAKTLLIYHSFVQHAKEPLGNTLSGLQEGYTVGLDTGDLEFSAYCAYLYVCHAFYLGRDLLQLDQEMRDYSHAIGQMNQKAALNWLQLTWQAVRNLLGQAEDPLQLVGDVYDERLHLPRYQAQGETVACCYVYLNRLMLGIILRQVEPLGVIVEQAESCFQAVVGLMALPLLHFYGALVLLANYPAGADPEATLAKATLYLDKLEQWAQSSPTIYTHKWQLVLAERHRVLGDRIAAIDAYDRAIAGATEQGYQQDAALANELAAEFYFAWGKDRIAQAYVLEAYYGYARWGATVKVLQLEQRYGSLLAPTLRSPSARLSVQESVTAPEESSYGDTLPTHASSSTSAALDMATILRVSQALSREIQVDRLIEMLLHVVIESAGADRCALVTLTDDRLMVEAIAESNAASQMVITLQSVPLDDCPDLPVGAIYSVKRSKNAMLITDALAHPTVSADSYIVTHQPKSLLCTPIVQQGKLFGLLYLENHLTIGAFTHDRIELINLLCTQAAISLENARLYERSQTYAQQLEESLTYLQESEARFQRLADNVPGMIYQFYLTPDGQKGFSYVSSGCWDIYGISPEVAMEQGELLLMAPTAAAQAQLDHSVLQSAQNLMPWQWEGLIRLPSGQVKWIQAASRPERLEDGTIQWDGVVIDIDDRKQAEAALRQSEAELRQKSQELEQILQTLKSAQLQLVQSEKMSALGNLVAGVAHEINNPIGFLAGNLRPAQDYVQDLLRLVDQYQAQFPKPGAAIEETIEDIDLDYVREDLPKLLSSMQLGIDRIRNISTGLRTFSRADKDYKVPFNLHDGIDSTVLILQHRLKANSQRPAIAIVRNYAEIPEIKGFPGQMNQVFMNLLANSIDALDEQFSKLLEQPYEQRQGCITITTSIHAQNHLKIQIADNGIGMTEETRQRIFDHLFTTKEVGKGTGLGLAIARQIIVEKHGGTIEVYSSPGEGTEFVIEIPIGSDAG